MEELHKKKIFHLTCFCNIIKTVQVKNFFIYIISDTSAIIGPSLNLKNFEVDISLKEKFINKKEKYKNFFKKNPFSHKTYFDMRGLLEYQLREASIDSIYHVNNDTYSEESLFFSHRRESHRKALPTGRMINIIGFRQ